MPTPSLLIVPARFKTGKLYSQIPTSGAGDFTVTRNTEARRFDSAGLIASVASGIPRLDYYTSGGTVGCPALLVEPSAQNLLQRSEEFNNAYWSKINCVASGNLTIAPDGNLTADKLIMDNGILPSAANQSGITRSETITSSAYRFSVFAKSAEFTGFRVRENAVNGTFLDVNLTNGAITNPDVTQFINPLAENYGNGWYRISWTSPTITNLNKYTIRVGSTGDGVSGIFIWGAQLETGSVATSYIPTTTGSVTRNADVISVSGAVSGSIGQTEGTMYWEGAINRIDRVFFALSSGTSTTQAVRLQTTGGGLFQAISISGTVQCNIQVSGAVNLGEFYKIAFAYKENDFVLYINGTQRGTDTSGTLPTNLNSIYLCNSNGTEITDQRCRAAALYTTRLTNAQLAALTTP